MLTSISLVIIAAACSKNNDSNPASTNAANEFVFKVRI